MIILNDHINPTSIGLFWAIYGRRNLSFSKSQITFLGKLKDNKLKNT